MWDDIEGQKLTLEYIKTAAIIAGVVFGLIGIYTKSDEMEQARLSNTFEMMKFTGTEAAATAAVALTNATNAPPQDSAAKVKLIVELAPWKEHFRVWGACIQYHYCDSKGSILVFCERLTPYEDLIAKLYPKIGLRYDRAKRNREYSGQLDRCKTADVSARPGRGRRGPG